MFEVAASFGWWLVAGTGWQRRGWTMEVWRGSVSWHVFPLKATTLPPPLCRCVEISKHLQYRYAVG